MLRLFRDMRKISLHISKTDRHPDYDGVKKIKTGIYPSLHLGSFGDPLKEIMRSCIPERIGLCFLSKSTFGILAFP